MSQSLVSLEQHAHITGRKDWQARGTGKGLGTQTEEASSGTCQCGKQTRSLWVGTVQVGRGATGLGSGAHSFSNSLYDLG